MKSCLGILKSCMFLVKNSFLACTKFCCTFNQIVTRCSIENIVIRGNKCKSNMEIFQWLIPRLLNNILMRQSKFLHNWPEDHQYKYISSINGEYQALNIIGHIFISYNFNVTFNSLSWKQIQTLFLLFAILIPIRGFDWSYTSICKPLCNLA